MKNKRIEIRCTEKEKNKLKAKALLYFDGSISDLILEAALEYIGNKKRRPKGRLKKRKNNPN